MYRKCFFIVIIALLLCSCGENLEVRERAFVQGMGISKDDKVNVCLRVFDGTDKTNEYRGTGDTLEDAINDAEMTQGKDFFSGHTEIAVISSQQKYEVIKELINTDISPGCTILYNDDPVGFVQDNDTIKVLDILETAVRNKRTEKINICDVINNNRQNP